MSIDAINQYLSWGTLVWIGIGIQILGLLCFLNFYFRKIPALPQGQLPGLTIIKPCYTINDWEERNFDCYFNQDYRGPYELIFVVSEETDPAVPLIQAFLKKYPKADAHLLISKTRLAYWQKIDAYYDGFQVAKHDMVIISDSDTIVNQSYVSQMVACLSEPGVSLVTTPQYDTGVNNFATALKTLGNNCDVATFMSILDFFVPKKKMGWGHSIGFRKSEFETFGPSAWDRLRNFFGDDLILPTLFVEHGKKVVFRNVYCPVQFSDKTYGQMLYQQERFAICQKIAMGTPAFICALFLLPHVTAFVNMVFSGFSTPSIVLFLTVFAVRVAVSIIFEGLVIKNIKPVLKYFWTIPIWDLMKIYFVGYALTQKQVKYHGKVYEIKESKVEPVS